MEVEDAISIKVEIIEFGENWRTEKVSYYLSYIFEL